MLWFTGLQRVRDDWATELNWTLNVNGLNAPTKRHRLAEWIQKQDPYIFCLQETHFRYKDTYRLKVRGWKNIFRANGKQKKSELAILISDKIDLKIKKITRDKEGHYIMIKGSIQEEDVTIVNIYATNRRRQWYSSTLAWKIPWTAEPGWLQSMGLLRVRLDWATSLSLFTFMHWRRKWQPTPVFLPGESQGRGSLVGCRLWSCTESDTTEAT